MFANIKRLGKYCVLLLCLPSLSFAETKMSAVLAQTELSAACQYKINALSQALIGEKQHRILRQSVAGSDTAQFFVLLSYNDQDSHVSFTAVPQGEDCEVHISESFELPASCVDARQALFKRWAMLGRLNDTTIVMRYDHPRDKSQLPADIDARATAILTQTQHGKYCLISKKQFDAKPLKPKSEK